MKPLILVFLALFSFSAVAQENPSTNSVRAGSATNSASAAVSKPIQFEEVYSLLKTNLADVSEQELSRMAALGLIKELGTRVQFAGTNDAAQAESTEALGRRATYNDRYGYIQVRSVNASLPSEFEKALHELTASNHLNGVVVDLRYAKGTDYEAAAKTGDHFTPGGKPLLSFGGKEIRSTDKVKAFEVPVAALVNGETSGAAEALAAILKETGDGLVIGSPTAGQARLFENFTLSTGQKLRVGKIPVEAGDHKVISAKGVAPDIAVTVLPSSEKLWYQDPYRTISIAANTAASTNATELASLTNRARRFNEAELVRRHREGGDAELLDENAPLADRPVIMDPALARALDFLKGIAVLQQHKPL